MGEIQYLRSWREILKSACELPEKKQEIAQAVGFVSVRTIDRWISGQSNPQKNEAIRKLSEAINSAEMLEALKREFPEAFQTVTQTGIDVVRPTLPFEFYRRVTHAYAHVPLTSRRWTIFHLVFNQMVPHLDTERVGLAIVYLRTDEVPGLLQFGEGAGNSIWTTRQVEQETIDGQPWLVQAVTVGRPFFVQSCATSRMFPPPCLLGRERIKSMGFFPLYRSGLTAGGVFLGAMQEDFFTPLRQTLIEEYSHLLSLALSDSDFRL